MKVQTISKKVCLLTSFFLLLNSVHIVQPAVGDTARKAAAAIREAFRAKLPGLISKAKSETRKSLSGAYQKIRGLKAEVVIDRLLANVGKLGGQVGKIKDCMLSGAQCSSTERAAFYATAITILALTAAVVGFTITVAATSKEPDQELNKAIESTSKEVEGWKPDAVFQRLGNKLASFKQSLVSMKQCLTKKQCTRQQKRTLYATAATIVALVTVTIGIGVGSYIYAQKQEAAKALEEAKRQEEAKAPAKPGPVKAVSEKELKELAVDQAEEKPEEPKTPFQRFMQKTVTVKEKGKTAIQAAAQQVREAVKEKSSKAREALATTADAAAKLALFQAAKKSLEKAQSIASAFIQKIRDLDIVQSVREILNMDLKPLTVSIAEIGASSTKMMGAIEKLYEVKLFTQIDEMVAKITQWQELGMQLYENVTELAKQLGGRGTQTTRLGTWWWGEVKEDEYPLAAKFDQLVAAYPELVARINGLDIATPGRLLNFALRDAAQMLKSAAGLKVQLNGKVILFLTNDIRTALATLEVQLVKLAGFIGSTTQMKPLIKAPLDASMVTSGTVKQFLTASVRNAVSPTLFRANVSKVMALPTQITESSNALYAETENLGKVQELLMDAIYNLPQHVRKIFVSLVDVKGKRLQNVAHAPALLRQAMITQLELVKKHLSATLIIGDKTIDHLGRLLQQSAELLNTINMLMGAQEGTYVNEDLIYGFKQMASIIRDMVTIVNKLSFDVKEQKLPQVAAAAAAAV